MILPLIRIGDEFFGPTTVIYRSMNRLTLTASLLKPNQTKMSNLILEEKIV